MVNNSALSSRVKNYKMIALKRNFNPIKSNGNDVTLYEFIHSNSHRFEGKGNTRLAGEHLKRTQSKLDLICAVNNLGNKSLTSINTGNIEDFFDFLEQNNFTNQTINRYAATWSVTLKYAYKTRLIAFVPHFSWRSVQEDGKPRFFNADEEKVILEVFRNCYWPWMEDLTIVALHTGIRRTVLSFIGSRVLMTDNENFLHIPREITKTNKERSVHLYDSARAAVKRLGDVSKYFRVHFYNKAWKKARKEIATGDLNFTGHVTRQTTATRLAEMNFNIKHIATYLVHSNVRTTMKYIKTSTVQLERECPWHF